MIALMEDQVAALNARGVKAAMLGSAQTKAEVILLGPWGAGYVYQHHPSANPKRNATGFGFAVCSCVVPPGTITPACACAPTAFHL